MIPISINTQDLTEQFSMTREDVENIIDSTVKEITASFASKWENQANISLQQTRSRYVRNLIVVDTGRMEGAVILDYTKDSLIRMLEEGAAPFDIKVGMSKSDKRKMNKKGGWYLNIPMRKGSPGAIGESSVFSGTLPEEVAKAVRAKPQIFPTKGGGMRSAGLSANEIPEQFKAPSVRPKIETKSQTFEQYESKSSIHQGVTRAQDPVTGQSTFMSFRTTAESSDSNSWIHKGFNEYNLAGKALSSLEANIQDELTRALDISLEKHGFE